MDSDRFDAVIRRVGTTQLTRGTALRGLAGGALAAVLGTALAAHETDAKKKRRRRKRKRGPKVTICHFTGSQSHPYQIITIPRSAFAKHVANHGDFEWRNSPNQVGKPCCLDAECATGEVCIGKCVDQTLGCEQGGDVCDPFDSDCCSGLICVGAGFTPGLCVNS
jgi:hypothetical protein